MIRVAAIDDHPLFLEGLMRTLAAAPDFQIVGSGATADAAIRIAIDASPHVLILDMSLPEASNGTSALKEILVAAPAVRVLMLTVVADDDRVVEAIRLGASGYVLKGISGAELLDVIRLVHGGASYVTPTLGARLVARLGRSTASMEAAGIAPGCLGNRETQILELLVKGLSNKEIAHRLTLSDKTVKHYITGLLNKLHVRNRTEAAILASRWQVRPGHAGPSANGNGRIGAPLPVRADAVDGASA